jgi:hypothetical protein
VSGGRKTSGSAAGNRTVVCCVTQQTDFTCRDQADQPGTQAPQTSKEHTVDPMSEYLARAAIQARTASAPRPRAGRRLERARRAERRRRRRLVAERWWRDRIAKGPETGSWRLLAVTPPPDRSPSVELAQLLDDAAYRIAEHGTGSQRQLLEAMAEVATQSAPGAAGALADVSGSEASRLRAFGVVHTHVMEELGPREHAWLLDVVQRRRGLERQDRVA